MNSELTRGHVGGDPASRSWRIKPHPWQFAAARLLEQSTHFTTISTRRLFARPSGLLLSATGTDSPLPTALIRSDRTPLDTRWVRTASARRCESSWFFVSLPTESV